MAALPRQRANAQGSRVIEMTALVRELSRRATSDWTVIERRTESATVDEASGVQRREQRSRWVLIVHDDTPDGRGTARLELGAFDGTIEQLVDQAQRLARAAIGPAWVTRPPSAPAKIAMFDRALGGVELVDAAQDVLREMKRPRDVAITARAEVSRTDVTVRTAKGLRATWAESLYRAGALVVANDRSLEIVRTARTRDELGAFDAALVDAVVDLGQLAAAAVPTSGPCALVLLADALLADDAYGMWAPFAAQADAVRAREGLARYRLGMPIAPNADQLLEPLTITSDGALDNGIRSAPLDDEGSAIRRFSIVERGVAVGIGMRAREAAFLRADPNGGVRNLVVGTGSWDEAPPPGVRVVEVRRLHDLSIDPYTGDANLEIALGIDHREGSATPFSGGTIRLDLIAALAHARRSSIPIRRGPYAGPRAVLIDHAELIA